MMLTNAWICLLTLSMHPMPQERPIDAKNITIIGSQTFLRSDGRAALALMTRELGAIAFKLNQQSIVILRKHLLNAEALLRQSAGSVSNARIRLDPCCRGVVRTLQSRCLYLPVARQGECVPLIRAAAGWTAKPSKSAMILVGPSGMNSLDPFRN